MVSLKRLLPVSLVLAVACAHAPRPAETRSAPPAAGEPREEANARPQAERPLAEGVASFYGGALRGHLTANGERFDPSAMTAAHRTLPFGTCLRVQNVDNGRAVKVRINDRGPYVDGRILDLSEAAARKLALIQQGVGHVRLWRC